MTEQSNRKPKLYNGRLTAVLYRLLLDHVPVAKLEQLVKDTKADRFETKDPAHEPLADLAAVLAEQILPDATKAPQVECPVCSSPYWDYLKGPCWACNGTKLLSLEHVEPGYIRNRGCPGGCFRGEDPHPGSTLRCSRCNREGWRTVLP